MIISNSGLGFYFAPDERSGGGRQRSIQELAEALRKSSDPDVQSEAISSLKRFGEESLPLYIEALKSGNYHVKSFVIESLVELVVDRKVGDLAITNEILPALRELLINDPDEAAKSLATDALDNLWVVVGVKELILKVL